MSPSPRPGGRPEVLSVQIFGLEDSQPTRAAMRFFKERRTTIHFVDLRRKPIAAGELRRFTERLGAASLLDTEGRVYMDLGLGYLRMEDAAIVERLLADHRLIRLPLVRFGNEVTVGRAEAAWRAWFALASGILRE
jgi:arsenate reductase-like glutaredoxin family protein